MEMIGPHTGRWSLISGKIASSPFRTKYKLDTPSGKSTQEDFPRLISADSEGKARIFPSKFTTSFDGSNLTDAELRCEFSK